MNDRRKANRQTVSVPIQIVSTSQDQQPPTWHNGTSRDISTNGIYFICQHDIAIGSRLRVKIPIPQEVSGKESVVVDAIGKVLRVESLTAGIGVAVIIELFEMISAQPQ
jgi:hypothetical protein